MGLGGRRGGGSADVVGLGGGRRGRGSGILAEMRGGGKEVVQIYGGSGRRRGR